jgi:ribosomal protein S19E (S16A)
MTITLPDTIYKLPCAHIGILVLLAAYGNQKDGLTTREAADFAIKSIPQTWAILHMLAGQGFIRMEKRANVTPDGRTHGYKNHWFAS